MKHHGNSLSIIKAFFKSLSLLRVTGWVVLGIVLVLAWPNTLGGKVGYVIVSGHSMEPTYFTGDLLVTVPHSDFKVGDVIVYDVPKEDLGGGMSVVHRVIGGSSKEGWVTQGDNNPSVDIWNPTQEDIRGIVKYHMPHAGKVLLWVGSPIFIAFLGAIVVATILWPRDEASEGENGKIKEETLEPQV